MQPHTITFVERSFRDVADQDYIMARMAYRFDLPLQFIWLAQQAVEKYLKALLLFNNRSALKLRHNVSTAFRRVKQIRDVPFDFPKETANFMDYLDTRASRYFEFPYGVSTDTLFDLDRTVWFLRRYCDYLRGSMQTGAGKAGSKLQQEIHRRGDRRYIEHPYAFRITGGFLRSVLDHKTSKLRPFLTWNNAYFARRRGISSSGSRSFAANSDIALTPSLVTELANKVYFSAELKRRIKDWI